MMDSLSRVWRWLSRLLRRRGGPGYYYDRRLKRWAIDYVGSMGFREGSAFKYVWRSGRKRGERRCKDLRKAHDYLASLVSHPYYRQDRKSNLERLESMRSWSMINLSDEDHLRYDLLLDIYREEYRDAERKLKVHLRSQGEEI